MLTDVLPYSLEAEEALIGSLLVDPGAIKRVSVQPDDFHNVKLAAIYNAILAIHKDKIQVDYLTVVERLEVTNKMEYIGGTQELMRLVNTSPTALYAETYANIISDKARRRVMIIIAQNIANAARDSENIDIVISESISQLASKANIKNGAVHISDYVSRLYDVVDTRYQNPIKAGEVSGISSGFVDYDAITDGFHQGEETILSAEPGLGKSLLAFQMACNMSAYAPGAVYELEMSALSVVKREASNISRITTRDMNRGNIDDWQSFVKAVETMSTKDIFISDDSRLTTATLRADLARLREDHGIRWFVLDYLKLLKDRVGKDDTERTAWLSAEVHDICKDLNLAGLVIHSMNKSGVRERTGNQSDLAGSVQVLYDADQIIFMLRDEKYENVIHLKWAKFREGEMPTAGIQLSKLPGFPGFRNCAKI